MRIYEDGKIQTKAGSLLIKSQGSRPERQMIIPYILCMPANSTKKINQNA